MGQFMDQALADLEALRAERKAKAAPIQYETPADDGTIRLDDEADDFLPDHYDLGQQSVEDAANGVERPPGTISNRYLKPNTKTIHGIDVVTGRRVYDRDTGIPEIEKQYQSGIEKLRDATLTKNRGYDDAGVDGMADVASAVISEDKSYQDFERKLDRMGAPAVQRQAAWSAANYKKDVEDLTAALESAEFSDAEAPDIGDLTLDELYAKPEWEENTRKLFEMDTNQEFDGTPEQLQDWYERTMSFYNWSVPGMANYVAQAHRLGPGYAQALLQAVEQYDSTGFDTTWEQVGRNMGNIAMDPTSWVGLGLTKVGASLAARAGAQRVLTKLAVMGATAGAGEGALHTAGAEVAQEDIEQTAGYRDRKSPLRIAAMGVAGAGGGLVLGAGGGAGAGAARSIADRVITNYRKSLYSPGPMARQVGAVGNVAKVAPFRQKVTDSTMVPDTNLTVKEVKEATGDKKQIIEAFHGSPHKFDRFSMQNIGTGEGAQAYGHGLYFADSEEVARGYRGALTGRDAQASFQSVLPDDAEIEDVWDMLDEGVFTESQASVIRALAEDDWLGFDYPSQAINAAYRNLDNYDPSPELRAALAGDGALYRVHIDADPDTLLDWDKPLGEQPEAVQRALADIDPDMYSPDGEDYDSSELGQMIYQRLVNSTRNRNSMGVQDINARMAELVKIMDADSAGGYRQFRSDKGRQAAEEYDRLLDAKTSSNSLQNTYDPQISTSEQLAQRGIPGIRYLDGNSRSAGDGSYNYVVFDDSLITIKERGSVDTGILLPLAGIGAAGVAAQSEED